MVLPSLKSEALRRKNLERGSLNIFCGFRAYKADPPPFLACHLESSHNFYPLNLVSSKITICLYWEDHRVNFDSSLYLVRVLLNYEKLTCNTIGFNFSVLC